MRAYIIAAVVGAVSFLTIVLLAKQNGKLSARVKTAQKNLDTNERIRNASANTLTDRDSVNDSLRQGGF